MNRISIEEIQKMLETMTEVIIDNEVPFCELDSYAGDGDFGMSLAKGFKALKKEWQSITRADIGGMLKETSLIILENCGGASGPIWGSAFAGAAKVVKNKTELNLSEFAAMMDGAVAAIQNRGGAALGDKTLLDALIPAVESLKTSTETELEFTEALKKSAKAAVVGAEITKAMIASKGRASYVGERGLGHPDAGAYALGVIFTEVVNRL